MAQDSGIREKGAPTFNDNVIGRKSRRSKKTKRTVMARSVVARLPSRNAAEVPILLFLDSAPGGEMRTKAVLNELRNGRWFEELTTQDKEAVYEKSRKNVFDSIVKFSKKSLAIKKQVFAVGEAGEVGIWKVTEAGIERARKEGPAWRAAYSLHHALELDYANPPAAMSPGD